MTIAAQLISINQRQIAYLIVALALSLVFPILSNLTTWQATDDLHSVLEATATLLAFVVGALAVVEYQSKHSVAALFIASGFLGTAALEGYHLLMTSSYFSPIILPAAESPIPASWLSERLYLGLMLCLACYFSAQQPEGLAAAPLSDLKIYLTAAVLALAFLIMPYVASLPGSYGKWLIFSRPGELVAAVPCALALAWFYRIGNWNSKPFDHWLILALIVLVVAQFAILPFSQTPFDLAFNLGHILKNISYLLVFVGLLYNIHSSFTAINREIGKRKDAATKLRFEEIRKGSILKTMVDGLIVINDQGIVEDFNPAAEKIFGYRAQEVIGENVAMLMPPELASQHDSFLHHYKVTGEKRMLAIGGRETEAMRKDGRRFPISLAVAEMELGGEIKYSGLVRDISERKEYEMQLEQRREELEATNAELEKFAYVASHDLQEPLRKISAFGSRLHDKYSASLDDTGRDYLERMINASERMSTLINDLLAFSRLNTRNIELKPHDLGEIVDEVIGDLELIISKTQARVNIGEMPVAHCDPMQMRQLFQNLIGNSLKFQRPELPPVIDIKAERIGQFKGPDGRMSPWSRIEISDNGIGFPSQYYNKVFQIFQRLHSRQKYEGTGIGLAICRKVVELHGGNISVLSKEGEGTIFTFTLPIAVDASQNLGKEAV